jgi:MFS family permease
MRNVLLICFAAFVRSTSVGVTGVLLGIFLAQRGVSVETTGAIVGVGLAGASVATLIVTIAGDRFGRRRTLAVLAAFTAAGYMAVSASLAVPLMAALAFVGMLNGMGRDRGAAYALEQAILPETTDAAGRTWVLAWYNVVLDAGLATGALIAALPSVLAPRFGTDTAAATRWLFGVCAIASLATVALYASLSSIVETARHGQSIDRRPNAVGVSAAARRTVAKLAALFALDSLGSGFLSAALVSYWFFRRYGLSEPAIAALFFGARVLNAVSHVMAAWIARRIGLVNTMVATHLPSSVLLMTAPLTASPALAGALFLGREALVEMDVPTRQSYVMAVVEPHERTFASGVTNLTRTMMWAVAPPIAGLVMRQVLAAPLVIGCALKIAYDLLLYAAFRKHKAPEERAG